LEFLMSKLALTVAMPDYDHVRDLALGRVQAQGIDLTVLTFPVEEIFYRFLMYREWDVSEISFAKYASLIAQGDTSLIALPVFPSRMFRHSSLFVRRDGPIKKITDLSGRRVGVPEWAQTAAVYSRGLLVHQYGIKLSSIQWVQAGVNEPGRVEKVELKLPKGVKLTRMPDKSLNEMLLSGEIDAILAARPPAAFSLGDKRIKRFFENYLEVEADYYRETGIFPIMHAVAIKRDILDKNPWVARSLLNAFEEAKQRSVQRALDATVTMFPIPWYFETSRRAMDLLGDDYFPYGVEKNRKTLEAFLGYAFEQGVCKRRVEVDELFPKQLSTTYRV
jgi:4,5-dihydroxyphthalate decarboxylase